MFKDVDNFSEKIRDLLKSGVKIKDFKIPDWPLEKSITINLGFILFYFVNTSAFLKIKKGFHFVKLTIKEDGSIIFDVYSNVFIFQIALIISYIVGLFLVLFLYGFIGFCVFFTCSIIAFFIFIAVTFFVDLILSDLFKGEFSLMSFIGDNDHYRYYSSAYSKEYTITSVINFSKNKNKIYKKLKKLIKRNNEDVEFSQEMLKNLAVLLSINELS